MKSIPAQSVILVLSLAVGGCGLVGSEHPASDASTHVLDETLFGLWELVPMDSSLTSGERSWVLLGRKNQTAKELDAVLIEIYPNQRTEVGRMTAFSSRIGDLEVLSVCQDPDGEQAIEGYVILRYRKPDPTTLEMFALDRQMAQAAVESGTISGRVLPADSPSVPDQVFLEAETLALRKWLEDEGETVWEPFLVARRVE